MNNGIQIGSLNACIAGDYRYSTYLTVTADPSTREVVVEVAENGAAGGMDGPGGSTPMHTTLRSELRDPTPKQLVDAIREAIDFENRSGAGVLARYGKPTKNFTWGSYRNAIHGLSQAKAKAALERVFA